MVILASTDLNELWPEMTEIILENVASFSNEWIWVDISFDCES